MKKRILSLALTFALLALFIPSITQPALAAETKTLELVNRIDLTYNIYAVVANAKGNMLLIQESYTWNVYLYNIDTGVKKELVNTLTVGVGERGMCFSPDGSLCAVSTGELSDGTFNKAVVQYITRSPAKRSVK